MDYILGALLSYLLLYKYVALFIFIFCAAVILPLPSNALLLAVGAFASQKYFNFPLSFGVALVANVAGDVFDYWLAHRFGRVVIEKRFKDKTGILPRLERYIAQHAGWTVFLTRFITSAGTIVNFLAGFVRVSLKKFFFFDILGNALDLGSMLVLGFVAGIYWEKFNDVMDVVGMALLFLLVMFVLWKTYRWKKGRVVY